MARGLPFSSRDSRVCCILVWMIVTSKDLRLQRNAWKTWAGITYKLQSSAAARALAGERAALGAAALARLLRRRAWRPLARAWGAWRLRVLQELEAELRFEQALRARQTDLQRATEAIWRLYRKVNIGDLKGLAFQHWAHETFYAPPSIKKVSMVLAGWVAAQERAGTREAFHRWHVFGVAVGASIARERRLRAAHRLLRPWFARKANTVARIWIQWRRVVDFDRAAKGFIARISMQRIRYIQRRGFDAFASVLYSVLFRSQTRSKRAAWNRWKEQHARQLLVYEGLELIQRLVGAAQFAAKRKALALWSVTARAEACVATAIAAAAAVETAEASLLSLAAADGAAAAAPRTPSPRAGAAAGGGAGGEEESPDRWDFLATPPPGPGRGGHRLLGRSPSPLLRSPPGPEEEDDGGGGGGARRRPAAAARPGRPAGALAAPPLWAGGAAAPPPPPPGSGEAHWEEGPRPASEARRRAARGAAAAAAADAAAADARLRRSVEKDLVRRKGLGPLLAAAAAAASPSPGRRGRPLPQASSSTGGLIDNSELRRRLQQDLIHRKNLGAVLSPKAQEEWK